MESLASDDPDSGVYLRLGLIVEKGKRLQKPSTLLSRLASSLERSILLHDKSLPEFQDSAPAVTVFDGRSPPEITITDYLNRIFNYSRCSPSCFVVAYIYIHQFLDLTRAHLTPLNVHRLVVTSVMLAAKVHDDRYYNNAYYARVGGVSTRELNRLEMKLLFALDFKLQVDPHTFHSHCCRLEEQSSDSDDGFRIEWPVKEACRLNKETWRKTTPESVCSQTTAR
ncbi:Cyclin-U3-1 [Hirschfeldia incana]|nr:Cyclin-U3-1 [Hirschfeldia incana]